MGTSGGAYDLDVARIAEVWRRGSVVSSWLLDLTAVALAADPEFGGHAETPAAVPAETLLPLLTRPV